MVKRGIPYRLFGGVRFYERKEIRDILSYLKVLANPADTIALRRIINVPKRGIGETSLDKLAAFADENVLSLYGALSRLDEITTLKTRVAKFKDFYGLFEQLRADNYQGYVVYEGRIRAEAPAQAYRDSLAWLRTC